MVNLLKLKASIIFQFSILLIVNGGLTAYAQPIIGNSFELKGKIEGVSTGLIYLNYYIDKEQKNINDSSVIVDGYFSFKGAISEPTIAFIELYKKSVIGINSIDIFLEPLAMNVSLKLNKFSEVHLTGSSTQKEYDDLQALDMPMIQKYKPQLDEWANNQFAGNRDSLGILLSPLSNFQNKNAYTFFLSHPTSYVTAYLLQYHIRDLSVDSLIFFYSRLGNKLQQNIVIKNVRDKIEYQKVGTPGSMAKFFFAKDVNGNPLLSRLFKGRYLLLDFWASWCVPCRKNNPHLISLYKKYNEKGLAIIGIADDDNNITAWKKAIESDSIGLWNHVLRGLNKEAKLKGERNDKDISEKFAVDVLPTMILIDKNGMIIGRYTGTEDDSELDKKLNEIFEF